MSKFCCTSVTSAPGRGPPGAGRRAARTRCRSPSCRRCGRRGPRARDLGVGEGHLQRAAALEDLPDVGDVGALLDRDQRLGHPGDREVRPAGVQDGLRDDVDAALEDRDVQPGVLVEALVDRREVAGELRLGEPLQLQRHRASARRPRRLRAASSVAAASSVRGGLLGRRRPPPVAAASSVAVSDPLSPHAAARSASATSSARRAFRSCSVPFFQCPVPWKEQALGHGHQQVQTMPSAAPASTAAHASS